MTAGQWQRKYTSIFNRAGIGDAADEAVVLLCHVLKLNRAAIFARQDRELSGEELGLLENLANRRLKREPSAYILQNREFFGLDLYVDNRVLIPRPETEILVEAAIGFARCWVERNKKTITIADVGTGSGAIAVALALNVPGSLVYAADISPAALEVAAVNITRYGLNGCVSTLQSDLLQQINGGVDIIAANLPYVADDGMMQLQPEIADHEPGLALQGGQRGTEVIGRLLGQVPAKINPGGAVFLEIGDGQEDDIICLIGRSLPQYGFTLVKDLAGIHRVIKIEAKRLLTSI